MVEKKTVGGLASLGDSSRPGLARLIAIAALGCLMAPTAARAAAPVANDDFATTRSGPAGGEQVAIDPLANDTDPDGDTIQFVSAGSSGPSNGTVIVSPSGLIRYTPFSGFTGSDGMDYTITDGTTQVTGFVTFTVNADQLPVALDDSATMTNGPGQTVQVLVLANDSDPDDSLSYNDIVIVQQPLHGFVSQSCVGNCNPPEYQPTTGYTGPDSFTYQAVDPLGGTSNVATVSITVNGANQPPVANPDSATTRSGPTGGVGLSVDIAPLANDTDPDGDFIQFVSVGNSGPSNGTVIVTQAGSGQIRYTPNPGFTGQDSMDYVITDGPNQVTGIVTVTVTADQLPVAVDDSATVTNGPPGPDGVPISVLANDTDPDDSLAYSGVVIVQQPLHGFISQSCVHGVCNPPGYSPNPGYTGPDSFTYRATDPLGGTSNVATVSITVNAANSAPVAVDDDAGTVTIGQAVGVNVILNDTDPDGDPLTITAVTQGSIGTVAITTGNTVTYTSTGSGVGSDSFTYTIADGKGGTSTANVTIQVIDVASNFPPTAAIAGGNRTVADSNGAPGEAVAMDGSSSSDSNGTITTYQWSVNGQPVPTATGPTPTLQLANGPNTVSLVVVDNDNLTSNTASVTITVQAPTNHLPVVSIEVGSSSIPDSDGQPGETVPFRGSATDSDGTVAVSTFRWSVNGQTVPGANGQASPTLALANGSNSIVLSATDNSGGTGQTTVTVTVGEPGALAELPGVAGNENLENTAAATDSTCSALLKADSATLTEEQRNLRSTCGTIYANAEEDPAGTANALEQISAQQITSQQKTAIGYTSTQMLNLGARLTALRQGAKGLSLTGLNMGGTSGGVPVTAIASLGKALFGTGGSSGDDDGGLLDDRLGIFINGALRFGSKDKTEHESGFDFDTQGVTIGADYRFTDAFVGGLAIGYGQASAEFDANAGSQDSDSYSGSLYGSWYGQRSYVDGIASFGSISYDTLRKINLFDGEITDKATGNTDGTQWALGLSGGLDYSQGGVVFGPNLAVNYIKVDIDGFQEKTAGTSGLAMAFGDQTADSLTVKAGGHLSWSISRKWGVISPQARFDLVREFANDSQEVSVRYANDPVVTGPGQPGGTFIVFTDNPDEYYILWAVGVAVQTVHGLSGFVDYERTEALNAITSGELTFGLRYQTKFR